MNTKTFSLFIYLAEEFNSTQTLYWKDKDTLLLLLFPWIS